MADLYANENFPRPVAEFLRRHGHSVVTVQDTGQIGEPMSDPQVLEYAASRGWTVLTLNRKHFFRLHREKPNHSGIIACTYDSDFSRQANRIHDSILSEAPLAGKLIRVNRPATAQ
jgi:hypothetical protein